MVIEAVFAAGAVALCSLVGALFFGDKRLVGVERYVIPAAVGVFLSLTLFELIPETLALNETWGGVMVAAGFISFYILSYLLHDYFHRRHEENCERKGAATLLLIGDGIHNLADGVILGAAFLVNPAVGVATAIGLALHEIPQEIVEFGVLIRAGYTRIQAAFRNLISASSIILGTVATLALAEHAEGSIWIVTGLAAGNLLYLAASDLLPRIHGTLPNYGSFWNTVLAMVLGFTVMTGTLIWTHETFGHGHEHDEEVHDEDALSDHADELVPLDDHY
ncbi:MAG: ZIP family metal transporter [Candidatus Paceibacterota bacterium]